MSSRVSDLWMNAAMVSGVPVWIGVEFGLGYGAMGIIAGGLTSVAMMLAVYIISRRQWRHTVARRARYRMRGYA